MLSNCPYCDAVTNVSNIIIENDFYKIPETYDLYSDVNGSIDVNDLNIYYYDAQNTSPFKLLIPTEPTMTPIYRNNKEIIPKYDEDLGLYVYTINQKNLQLMDPIYWKEFDHINYKLDLEDNLYCMAQQYYISGTITKDNESIPFNFPFTPIFKN